MWMGIDVGTGGTRALLVDSQGKEVAAFTAPHEETQMARPLWAEQHPEDWARAGIEAIRGALSQAGANADQVSGIGLTGQMHGLVMLDEAGRVIRPSLIWCDQRSQPEVDFLNSKIGAEKILESIANPMLTGFTLPKLIWVRDHEPENFARCKKILLPKDYLRYVLTGEFATDMADASGTALLDVRRRAWSYEILDILELDRALVPRVYESPEVTATISKRTAELTGLRENTPVVAGAGDQAASAVGNGIIAPGIVSCTIGTSGVVFAHTETAAYDPLGRVHTFCHAIPGKWHVMGVTQGAGLSLRWLRDQLMPGTTYDEMITEAAAAPAGSNGLFWLPYLMGERTPHLDSRARGGWIGITAKHTRADLIRSVLEGVAYSQKDCLDVIENLGAAADSVRLSGGGARSLFWRQMFADVLGKRVATLETQEGSAYGAALLAMVGTGEYASVEESCGATNRKSGSLDPRSDEAAVYAVGHRRYRELYPALKSIFARMA